MPNLMSYSETIRDFLVNTRSPLPQRHTPTKHFLEDSITQNPTTELTKDVNKKFFKPRTIKHSKPKSILHPTPIHLELLDNPTPHQILQIALHKIQSTP